MENRFKRLKRYAFYLTQWFFQEKIKGLDFTMRDKSLISKTGGVLHGYSKTDERHAHEIFSALIIDQSKRLLDVGCGKGAFLREACKEPFGEIGGLEYKEELAKIARKNFERLQLLDRVKIFVGDAALFDHYDQYNVFYFFNPFNTSVMSKVIDRILEVQREDIWIILHNPVCAGIIVEKGGIDRIIPRFLLSNIA